MGDDWPTAFRRRPKAKIDTIRLRVELKEAATPRLIEKKTGFSCQHISPWRDRKTKQRIGNGSDRHWLVVIEDPNPKTWRQTVGQLVDGCAHWGLQQEPMLSSFDIALDWFLRGHDRTRTPEAADRWSWPTAEPLVHRLLESLDFDWRAPRGEDDAKPDAWRFEAIAYKTFVAIQSARLQGLPYCPIPWRLSQATFYAGDFEGRDKRDYSYSIPDENSYRIYLKQKDRGQLLDRADWRVRLECRVGPRALEAHGVRHPQDLLELRFEKLKEELFTFLRVHGQDADGAVYGMGGMQPRRADSDSRRKVGEALEALTRKWHL